MKKVREYLNIVPGILFFQIVMSLVLAGIVQLLNYLAMWAISSTGRVAVTTGDFVFLFTTWQGWAVLLIAVVAIVLYVIFDLVMVIAYTEHRLSNDEKKYRKSFKDALLSIKKFISPFGLIIILYIVVFAPISGGMFGISITNSLYVPNFITSVIDSKPVLCVLYRILIVVLFLLSNIYVFTLHGIVIDKMSAKDALRQSRRLLFNNVFDYIKRLFLFILLNVLIVVVLLVFFTSPMLLIGVLPFNDVLVSRILESVFTVLGLMLLLFWFIYFLPCYIIRITELYHKYRDGRICEPRKYNTKPFYISVICIIVLTSVIIGTFVGIGFDAVISSDVSTGIIAHRGGGNDGVENTVNGVEAAIKEGVQGSEIDIQRTKDGYYVVNHDKNFQRVAGNQRKPCEMTLSEIKKLKVFEKEEVATFEEMLDASKNHLTLYVELKGETADIQMADDTVKTIKDKDMVDETCVISLKYDLVKYIEETYPEINTGYLLFASYGNFELMECDVVGIEEEMATDYVIERIHSMGKKVMVWTPNNSQSQRDFLLSEADCIITDNIKQANDVINKIEQRDDIEKITDLISRVFFNITR